MPMEPGPGGLDRLKAQLPKAVRGKVLIVRQSDPFGLRNTVTFTLPNKHTIECVIQQDGTIPGEVLAKLCLLV